jgi:hypothetical protein
MFESVYQIALKATSFKDLQAKLKDHYFDEIQKTHPFLTVAGLLAQDAQHEKVEWLRRLGANVDKIAEGYVLAGNHLKVKEYVETHKADINSIAYAYAITGNYQQVEVYRTRYDADINAIVAGFRNARNHKQLRAYSIDDLLDSYLRERTAQRDTAGRTKEYFYGSFFSVFQKSFTQKTNAVEALKRVLAGEPIDLSNHLSTLRNGNLGKELRAFIKSGKANGLVDKEVNTVSAFVEALQMRNIVETQAQEVGPSPT